MLLLRRFVFYLRFTNFQWLTMCQAEAIRIKVGYPVSPNTLDPRSIDSYYRLVDIKDDKFFENIVSAA